MLESVQSSFKIPELRRRILFTLGIFVVYRIGGHIPIPGIDGGALMEWWDTAQRGIFGLYDMFVGGNFRKATIFALGIMPYISASIILQLLGPVIPYFQKLQREEEGRKKINQYTRYGTVLLSAVQALSIGVFWQKLGGTTSTPVVPNPGMGFLLLTMITVTAGTIFIMWLGERIDEHGIGNGISLIIFIGIVARFPWAVKQEIEYVLNNDKGLISELFLIAVMVAVVAGAVLLIQGQRRIPVQYAGRTQGRRTYRGQTIHIPLRVNTAGVIPIIFASAIMFLPQTMTTFFQNNETMQALSYHFSSQSIPYMVFFSLLIIFFAYFYTSIVVNPVELAGNIKKYGGHVPGRTPGKSTADYIDRILTRITLPGAIFLAFIAIFPSIVLRVTKGNVSAAFASFFGGTGLLIVVGVALDTLQKVESHLVMRHYSGFMKKGRMKGRL